jgi:hypothetical protein
MDAECTPTQGLFQPLLRLSAYGLVGAFDRSLGPTAARFGGVRLCAHDRSPTL